MANTSHGHVSQPDLGSTVYTRELVHQARLGELGTIRWDAILTTLSRLAYVRRYKHQQHDQSCLHDLELAVTVAHRASEKLSPRQNTHDDVKVDGPASGLHESDSLRVAVLGHEELGPLAALQPVAPSKTKNIRIVCFTLQETVAANNDCTNVTYGVVDGMIIIDGYRFQWGWRRGTSTTPTKTGDHVD